MSEISSVVGRVAEVERFVNANKQGAPRWDFPERRELWLQTPQGRERKLIIHTRAMPARRGHDVVALVHRQVVVGLFNQSTDDAVNYTREDPARLLRLRDFFASTAIAICGAFAAGPYGLTAGPASWLFIWLVRLLYRFILQIRVDAVLAALPDRASRRSQQ